MYVDKGDDGIAEIRSENYGEVCLVQVTGAVDLATAPSLKRSLHEAADAGCRHAIVDLTGVCYMDSCGYGALLSAVRRLRPVEGILYLVGCEPAILRMLQVTRLERLFCLCSTLAEARSAIRGHYEYGARPPAFGRD
jgi:anti-anti-sigma factor